jgi:hypothetical protein
MYIVIKLCISSSDLSILLALAQLSLRLEATVVALLNLLTCLNYLFSPEDQWRIENETEKDGTLYTKALLESRVPHS